MDVQLHCERIERLAEDLVHHLRCGDAGRALQTVTALRARCDVVGSELITPVAIDGLEAFELSEVPE